MCGSIKISLLAAAAHGITIHQVFKSHQQHKRSLLIFLSFYLIMELYQAFQWIFLQLPELGEPCNAFNTNVTYIAYLLIWLQPLLFSYLSSRSKHLRPLAWLTLVSAVFSIYLASNPNYILPNSNFYHETCTYNGDHLDWIFAVKTVVMLPNYYAYWSPIALSILYFETELKWTVGIGWLSSLIIALLLNGPGAQLTSFWCQLSICADLPILLSLRRSKQHSPV